MLGAKATEWRERFGVASVRPLAFLGNEPTLYGNNGAQSGSSFSYPVQIQMTSIKHGPKKHSR